MTDFINQQQQQDIFNPKPSLLSQTIIRPGEDNPNPPSSRPVYKETKNYRIKVPQYLVNGGFNQKFVSDPYNVELYNILTPGAYEKLIEGLNDALKGTRAKKVDLLLFSMGATMLPLIPWALRHYKMRKLYKKIMLEEIRLFNDQNPGLFMRWNRKPESCLTIELRTEQHLVGTKATGGSGSDKSRRNVGSGVNENDRFSIGSVESSEMDGNQLDMRPLKGNKLE